MKKEFYTNYKGIDIYFTGKNFTCKVGEREHVSDRASALMVVIDTNK